MAQEVESKAFAAKKRRDTVAAWKAVCRTTALEMVLLDALESLRNNIGAASLSRNKIGIS